MATPAVSQLHWKKSAACSTPMRLPFWLLTPDFHIPQGYQGRSPCLVSDFQEDEIEVTRTRRLECNVTCLLSPGCTGEGQAGREFGRPGPRCSMMRPTRV